MSEDAGSPSFAHFPPPSPNEGVAPAFSTPVVGPPEVDATSAPRKRSVLRRLFRPWVVITLVAAVIVAGNVWMYVLVDGWRAEATDLRESAHATAASVGEANAVIESQEAMLALLADQAEAAQDWATELDGEIAAKKAISDAYKNAALAYERCGDKRAEAIATLWSGGSASALVNEANAECASAQAQLDALEGRS